MRLVVFIIKMMPFPLLLKIPVTIPLSESALLSDTIGTGLNTKTTIIRPKLIKIISVIFFTILISIICKGLSYDYLRVPIVIEIVFNFASTYQLENLQGFSEVGKGK